MPIDLSSKFRVVGAGGGGEFLFREQTPDDALNGYKSDEIIPYIGVDHCTTCVGVWFPVDSTRCFVAHIMVFVEQNDGSWGMECNEEQASRVKKRILDRFHEFQNALHWDLDRKAIRDNYIVMSPRSRGGAGQYVIEAIKEFLEFPELNPLETSEGFCVDRRDQSIVTVPYIPMWARPGLQLFDGLLGQAPSPGFAHFEIVQPHDMRWFFKLDRPFVPYGGTG